MNEITAMIATPDMSFALLVLGVYGVFFEILMPGIIFPGITGIVCLVISIICLNLLPLNIYGIWLIVAGFGLLIAEALLPTFGILAIIGTFVFASGGYIMIDKNIYGSGVSLWLICLVSFITLAMIFYISRIYIKSRKAQVTTGAEGLQGAEGKITAWDGQQGEISAAGAIWKARSSNNHKFKIGDKAVVTAIEGLTLIIEQHKQKENEK